MVIAIIALLAALLLPSLRRARQAAQTAVCQNNLRQVATAVVLYAGDNDDQLPYHVDCYAPTVWTGFPALLKAGLLPSAPLVLLTDVHGLQLWSRPLPVLRCPGEKLERMTSAVNWADGADIRVGTTRNGVTGLFYAGYPYEWKHSGTGVATHYMLNGLNTNYYYPPNESPGFSSTPVINEGTTMPQMRLSRVPATTWLAFDGTAGDFAAFCQAYRHPNFTGNFMHFDGHVERLGLQNVDGQAAAGNDFVKLFPYDSRSYAYRNW